MKDGEFLIDSFDYDEGLLVRRSRIVEQTAYHVTQARKNEGKMKIEHFQWKYGKTVPRKCRNYYI